MMKKNGRRNRERVQQVHAHRSSKSNSRRTSTSLKRKPKLMNVDNIYGQVQLRNVKEEENEYEVNHDWIMNVFNTFPQNLRCFSCTNDVFYEKTIIEITNELKLFNELEMLDVYHKGDTLPKWRLQF